VNASCGGVARARRSTGAEREDGVAEGRSDAGNVIEAARGVAPSEDRLGFDVIKYLQVREANVLFFPQETSPLGLISNRHTCTERASQHRQDECRKFLRLELIFSKGEGTHVVKHMAWKGMDLQS
jgi:hypothetical protein